ncbi:DUF1223 domain-containing protein [Paracoccus subflavus]|uniref:DUF1223 domain-containing protein n=2 Tax=Paracoccus subflavus TaxID=2528244 RepID=A0A4Q9G330_9RHOB|nr:DUF1223 domain-containing protein [Paracoccus subflavus]
MINEALICSRPVREAKQGGVFTTRDSRMLAATAAFRSRCLAAAVLCGLFAGSADMVLAQEIGRDSPAEAAGERGAVAGQPDPGADRDNPPVIEAPHDPGRWAPSAGYAPTELGGANSFAATDVPPMESYGFSDAVPVVVELFTSQGCSSCPAADAMLSALADKADILPLSYHVDYWDYLGWADSFARPEFSKRQESYARAAGEHAVYTPQLIVAGSDTALSLGPAQLMGLIDASRFAPALVSVQRKATPEGQVIKLMPLSDLGDRIQILLVRYAPRRTVDVTGGENYGKRMTYANVVLSLEVLAEWDGAAPLRVTVKSSGLADDSFPADTRHAVLVQRELGRRGLPGPILAAVRLD